MTNPFYIPPVQLSPITRTKSGDINALNNAANAAFDNVNAVLTAATNVNVTPVSNAGTAETDLMTYTLPANFLDVNGKTIRITAWGVSSNTISNKNVRLRFDGQSLINAALTVSVVNRWLIQATISRNASFSQTYCVERKISDAGGSSASILVGGTSAFDTSPIIIKCTGQGGATFDIEQDGMLIEFLN